MDTPIEVELINRGIIDGMATVEVVNTVTGETVGWNQTAEQPEPTVEDIARESALAKLAKLGLTAEDITAIITI